MANKVVQLIDKDDNNIFPVAGSMAGDSIATGMIQDDAITTAKIDDDAVTTAKIDDGAITADKFADNAVTRAIVTAEDLAPSADTPAGWTELFNENGLYATSYDNFVFSHQPTVYGLLETYKVGGGNTLRQRFQTADGRVYFRAGDIVGWYGSSTASGSFRMMVADEYLGNNVDLDTLTKTGTYRVYAPLTNAPSQHAYATVAVYSYSDDYRCTQYFNGIGDNGKGIVAARFSYDNNGARAWSTWQTIVEWT